MARWELYSDSRSITVYKAIFDDDEMAMIFNKELKTVHTQASIWHSNGEPVLLPQDENIKHSCHFGHYQKEDAELTLEDVKFMYETMKNLFVND